MSNKYYLLTYLLTYLLIKLIDYKIWVIIQQRDYQTKVQDVNDLMQHLIDVWAGVEQSVIDDATDSGAGVSIPVFKPQENILNIHCDTY